MQLRLPVDVMILQALSNGEHANPIRIRYKIHEEHDLDQWGKDGWSLDYITQRMGVLRQFDMLERVPPDDSGIYRLTPTGSMILQRWLDTGQTEYDVVEAREAAGEIEHVDHVEPDAISPDVANAE